MGLDIHSSSRARVQRVYFAVAIFSIVIGFLTFAGKESLSLLFFGRAGFYPEEQVLLLFGISLIGSGVGVLLILYLRGAISFKYFDKFLFQFVEFRESNEDFESDSDASARKRAQDISSDILRLAAEVNELKSAQLGALAGNRAELIAALEPTVLSGLADELERRFSTASNDAATLREIRDIFLAARQRLRVELDSLSRRSNLNLVIGVLTTISAVGLLSYMVLGNAAKFESIVDLLSHYVPRVTIVIFIEVFSFFFLRLYRATLSEIRTYQDDLTLLAIQHVAVETAWTSPDPIARTTLSKELLAQRGKTDSQYKTSTGQPFDPDALAKLLVQFSKIVLKKDKGNND